MKSHMNWEIYDGFYYMKDINYKFNNPLETRTAPTFEINIKKPWMNKKISRNAIYSFS